MRPGERREAVKEAESLEGFKRPRSSPDPIPKEVDDALAPVCGDLQLEVCHQNQ